MKHRTVYRVTCGTFERDYCTEHHAWQMARALQMHDPLKDMHVTVEAIRVPDDALSRLTTIQQ